MHLLLSTWSLHRLFFAGSLPLRSMPALGKSLGFDGVELEDIWFPSGGKKLVDQLRKESKAFNSRIVVAVSNDFTLRGRNGLKAQIAHTIQFLRIAKKFDSGFVRILMGSRNSRRQVLDQVRSGIDAVLPVARKLGLRLAIENHDPLSRNPETLLSVLDEFHSPDLGLCLDFGNLRPSQRYEALQDLSPRAFMVHAKSYRFNDRGEEERINYRKCFSILRKQGFNGPVVVEYDGPGDQLLGSLRTKRLVERHWKARLTR